MADAKVDMALGKSNFFICPLQLKEYSLDEIIKKNRGGPGNRRGRGRGGNTIQRRGGSNQRGNRGGRIGKNNNNSYRGGGDSRRGGGRNSFSQRNNNRGNRYETGLKIILVEENEHCFFLAFVNNEAEEIQFQVLVVEI